MVKNLIPKHSNKKRDREKEASSHTHIAFTPQPVLQAHGSNTLIAGNAQLQLYRL